jgi:hypothetical protein
MEDRPSFEIRDGAVVHPLIAPTAGWSLEEKLAGESAAALGGW